MPKNTGFLKFGSKNTSYKAEVISTPAYKCHDFEDSINISVVFSISSILAEVSSGSADLLSVHHAADDVGINNR